MKRYIFALIAVIFASGAYADDNADITTDAFIPSFIVADAIEQFIPDNGKNNAANMYIQVMNQETGTISATALSAVCRAGGLDTTTDNGMEQCEKFVKYMLAQAIACQEGDIPDCKEEFDETDLDVFCPETGNSLRTINAQSRTGDVCTSSNIKYGTVLKHKNKKSCGCLAWYCNDGYYFNRGKCKKIRPKPQQPMQACPRSEHIKTDENKYTNLCQAFCEKRAKAQGCLHKSYIMAHSVGKCICNATAAEHEHVRNKMREDAERRRQANIKYYAVCGNDKGKTHGKEYCVEDFFNWTEVQLNTAIGLAQEYAYVKNKHNVMCSSDYRPSWNDDYIKCSDVNNKYFYEFKFNDVVESDDKDAHTDTVYALCKLYGGPNAISTEGNCQTTKAACNKLGVAGEKFALEFKWLGKNNICYGYNRAYKNANASDKGLSLKKINGLDNCIFYVKDGIEVRLDAALNQKIKQYISGKMTVKSFKCDARPSHVNSDLSAASCNTNSSGAGYTDDILRCYVNEQPIDFIFDDLSETIDGDVATGHAAMQCVISGGKYDKQLCRWLTVEQCTQLSTQIPGGTRWDNDAGACVLIDARQHQNFKDGVSAVLGTLTAIVVTVATGGGTILVATVVGVDVALTAAFVKYEQWLRNNPQHRATQFIKDAQNCNNPKCAKTVIQTHFVRLNEILSDLNTDMQADIMKLFDTISQQLTDAEFNAAMDSSSLNIEDYALNIGGVALALGAVLAMPEKTVMRAISNAPRLTQKLTTWANNTHRISGRLLGYPAEFRAGSSNSLGHDYYRIFVNNDTDAQSVIATLRNNGFYVATNSTQDGRRFVAASRNNIFGNWGTATSLRQRASANFDTHLKNFMNSGAEIGFPESRLTASEWAQLNQQLSANGVQLVRRYNQNAGEHYWYFTKISKNYVGAASNTEKMRRVLAAGDRTAQYRALGRIVFDPQAADNMIDGLSTVITDIINRDTNLLQQIRNWDRIDLSTKKAVVDYLNYNIAGLRRKHSGNTVISFGNAGSSGRAFASFRHETPYSPKQYTYSLDGTEHTLANAPFSKVLDSIIHENIHSWQYTGTSTIPIEFVNMRNDLKTPDLYKQFYREDLLETETFYIAPKTAQNVVRGLNI